MRTARHDVATERLLVLHFRLLLSPAQEGARVRMDNRASLVRRCWGSREGRGEAGDVICHALCLVLTASTLLRSWGFTLWSFWQNASQRQLYGSQANTLVGNAGVLQIFGAKNHRMAQDLANIIGGVSAEQILRMKPDEQFLLIDGKLTRAGQARYCSDSLFAKS